MTELIDNLLLFMGGGFVATIAVALAAVTAHGNDREEVFNAGIAYGKRLQAQETLAHMRAAGL
jgi:hypothetical protein